MYDSKAAVYCVCCCRLLQIVLAVKLKRYYLVIGLESCTTLRYFIIIYKSYKNSLIYYSKHVNVVIEKVYFLKITSMAEGNKMERIVESYYCRSLDIQRWMGTRPLFKSGVKLCKLLVKTENDKKETREYEFSVEEVSRMTSEERLKLYKDIPGLRSRLCLLFKYAYDDDCIVSTQFSWFISEAIMTLEDDVYRDRGLDMFYKIYMPVIVLDEYSSFYSLCEAYSGWLDEHREEWDFIDEEHQRKWLEKEKKEIDQQRKDCLEGTDLIDPDKEWEATKDEDVLKYYTNEYKKFRYLLENKLVEILRRNPKRV